MQPGKKFVSGYEIVRKLREDDDFIYYSARKGPDAPLITLKVPRPKSSGEATPVVSEYAGPVDDIAGQTRNISSNAEPGAAPQGRRVTARRSAGHNREILISMAVVLLVIIGGFWYWASRIAPDAARARLLANAESLFKEGRIEEININSVIFVYAHYIAYNSFIR